jgi:hypothetical protein
MLLAASSQTFGFMMLPMLIAIIPSIGRLHVGCLFPQVVGYNAIMIAASALLIAVIAMMK